MSWLPHTIFHCHERQDSITRDAQRKKQVCASVCVCVRRAHGRCVAFINVTGHHRTAWNTEPFHWKSINLISFIKWNNSSLVHFNKKYAIADVSVSVQRGEESDWQCSLKGLCKANLMGLTPAELLAHTPPPVTAEWVNWQIPCPSVSAPANCWPKCN